MIISSVVTKLCGNIFLSPWCNPEQSPFSKKFKKLRVFFVLKTGFWKCHVFRPEAKDLCRRCVLCLLWLFWGFYVGTVGVFIHAIQSLHDCAFFCCFWTVIYFFIAKLVKPIFCQCFSAQKCRSEFCQLCAFCVVFAVLLLLLIL